MQRHKVILSMLSIFLILFAAAGAMAEVKEHREIKGPFTTPSEVTIKCLACHDQEAEDFMKTQHWKWEQLQIVNCEEMVYGKKQSLTNFAITLKGNWKHCTSCHDGYGWQDGTFDFTDKTKIDCIGCHDTTGTYEGDSTAEPAQDIALGHAVEIGSLTAKELVEKYCCDLYETYGNYGEVARRTGLDWRTVKKNVSMSGE